MRISTIAFANLRRRKGKAAFLAFGIAIGIATVVTLTGLSSSVRREIGAQLDQFGANIVVVPRSESMAVNYGGVSVSSVLFDEQTLTQTDAARILEIPYSPRLSVIAPKLLGGVPLEGHQVLLAGVDFTSELKLKRWWRLIGRRPEGEGDVLVGYDVAKSLSLVTELVPHRNSAPDHGRHATSQSDLASGHGDSEKSVVRRQIQIGGRALTVSAVIAPTGGSEDKMLFTSLNTAQALLKRPEQLSLIEVSALCKDCPVGDIVQQINHVLPHAKVSAVQQTVLAREQAVDRLSRFSAAVSTVVVAIGGLLVFTTMTGSVVERTREIGVLRAIGFRKSHVIRCLCIEVAAISSVGGLVGWLLGSVAEWIALPHFAETELAFDFRASLLTASLGGALAIGIFSALYPIYRASRLDPTEAIRYA